MREWDLVTAHYLPPAQHWQHGEEGGQERRGGGHRSVGGVEGRGGGVGCGAVPTLCSRCQSVHPKIPQSVFALDGQPPSV